MTPSLTIWDAHYDEYARLVFHLGNPEHRHHRGENQPAGVERLICHEGPWLDGIAPQVRRRSIIAPCVPPHALGQFKNKGFTKAFTKDEAQRRAWGDNAVTLPPVVSEWQYDKSVERPTVSLVHFYVERHPDGAKFTREAGCPNYGISQHSTPGDDIELLKTSRFLLHAKEMGYLCNAVIKAISARTPIIFTPGSWQYGYADYLTPGFDCLIVKTPQDAIAASEIPETEYQQMRQNMRETIRKIQATYPSVREAAVAMVKSL